VERVLVTGGAGFIGSHLVDALLRRGAKVRVLDSLDPQVHGQDRRVPDYLHPDADLVLGDVRDRDLLARALDGIDSLFHLAAAVGVGQSMYEIERYVSVNTLGTATLLDLLANWPHSVRKLVVASSMSIYGEGSYRCERCGPVEPLPRTEAQMRDGIWEALCPACGSALSPVPTGEQKALQSGSIYAISKKDQEEMCLCVGGAYGLPAVALRFFNVYGPRQALSNPYTGAVAIFSSRAMNGKSPLVYEDGLQTRDFVHVSDVIQALLLAMDSEAANYRVFNVGAGRPRSILEVANAICALVGPPGLRAETVGRYRKGDIRHCYADIQALSSLGYSPRVDFETGLRELVGWLREQTAHDGVEQAAAELTRRGLIS
jgi:dTDP-L-rhamnose 4-epimerase